MTEKMTGGEAMARQLAHEGVTHIFGIPGVQLDYATNGLSKVTDRLRFIPVRHEQTATYAADGYARTTGRVGVGLVVPGPGVLNAGAGLVTSWAVCSKVLLIAGQLPTAGWANCSAWCTRSPTRRHPAHPVPPRRARHRSRPGARRLRQAMAALAAGPGPWGRAAARCPVRSDRVGSGGRWPRRFPAPPADAALLDDAAVRLGRAQRPILIAGGVWWPATPPRRSWRWPGASGRR
ncbi:MAG: thiamine pyrophosphate-binding protein [Acidimicrobiales bacterium]